MVKKLGAHRDMQSEEASYKHWPVDGLPKSLVEPVDGTVAVVALMRHQGGLNRQSIRKFRSDFKPKGDAVEALAQSLFKSDWQLLSRYLSASRRWANFWRCVESLHKKIPFVGTPAYAAAVDIQLLDAYDKSWASLVEDADALTLSCLKASEQASSRRCDRARPPGALAS